MVSLRSACPSPHTTFPPIKQALISSHGNAVSPLAFPFSPGRRLPNPSPNLTVKCSGRKPAGAGQSPEQPSRYEFERLFSNLNQATLKREPGSLTSAVFLVAGTTVGAGILAIPAVTQESGFLASAVASIGCWVYMVATGLLVAEVNINTMCELGSGGVSLVSMARRTLGPLGVQVACWSYIFIHYALLVAYVARSSDILTNFLDGKVQPCFQSHWEEFVTFAASGFLVPSMVL